PMAAKGRAVEAAARDEADETVTVAKRAHDPHLAQELGLSSCAMHYEKLGDSATANVAVDEWLAVRPGYFHNLLIKARVQYHMKNYPEAEQYFLRALKAGQGLCNLGVDITVTQRK